MTWSGKIVIQLLAIHRIKKLSNNGPMRDNRRIITLYSLQYEHLHTFRWSVPIALGSSDRNRNQQNHQSKHSAKLCIYISKSNFRFIDSFVQLLENALLLIWYKSFSQFGTKRCSIDLCEFIVLTEFKSIYRSVLHWFPLKKISTCIFAKDSLFHF